jgi:hypothetical protein
MTRSWYSGSFIFLICRIVIISIIIMMSVSTNIVVKGSSSDQIKLRVSYHWYLVPIDLVIIAMGE